MSLVKKPLLTPAKLAANQHNSLKERVLSEIGRANIIKANLRHGFYSKHGDEAIQALDENPDDLDRLLESLEEDWAPGTVYEKLLVRRLARAFWRLERADHMQEAIGVCQAEMVSRQLDAEARAEDARHQRTMVALEGLLKAVQEAGFAASQAELESLLGIYGSKPTGRPRQIIYRLFHLRAAPEGTGDQQPLLPGEAKLEPAQGEHRIRLQTEIASLVREEMEALKAAHQQQRESRARELSPALIDAYRAPDHPRADFMLRAENSAFRQVERLTQLLMKVQKQREEKQGRTEGQRRDDPNVDYEFKNEGDYHDPIENKASTWEAQR
jgi:hypothetical protein